MFREEEVTPIRPEAQRFAAALTAFLRADRELEEAMEKVPSYTGQWSSKDYYAEEQNTYNVAANELADAIKEVCR